MSHDDGFCGCNTGPEPHGCSQREENTISEFHCYANARQISETLVPPNANELDIAAASVATGRADPAM
jgi:hypothetical protein